MPSYQILTVSRDVWTRRVAEALRETAGGGGGKKGEAAAKLAKARARLQVRFLLILSEGKEGVCEQVVLFTGQWPTSSSWGRVSVDRARAKPWVDLIDWLTPFAFSHKTANTHAVQEIDQEAEDVGVAMTELRVLLTTPPVSSTSRAAAALAGDGGGIGGGGGGGGEQEEAGEEEEDAIEEDEDSRI